MNQDTGLVIVIVGVACQMGAAIHQHHTFAEGASHLSGHHGPRKSGAHDYIVKHGPDSPATGSSAPVEAERSSPPVFLGN